MEIDYLEELIKYLKALSFISFENKNDKLYIKINENTSKDELVSFLNVLYDYEYKLTLENKNIVILDFKHLQTEVLSELFKFSFTYDNLCDANVLLNILNLIKTYNSLEDSFFDNTNICFDTIDKLLDIKLEIRDEIKEFQRKLSIYFISVFKSYNKQHYSPLDIHIKLPLIYKNLFMSSDILTLFGIFAVSPDFSTTECVYIDDALDIVFPLLEKAKVSSSLLTDFINNFKSC